jgi:hypothetical protein
MGSGVQACARGRADQMRRRPTVWRGSIPVGSSEAVLEKRTNESLMGCKSRPTRPASSSLWSGPASDNSQPQASSSVGSSDGSCPLPGMPTAERLVRVAGGAAACAALSWSAMLQTRASTIRNWKAIAKPGNTRKPVMEHVGNFIAALVANQEESEQPDCPVRFASFSEFTRRTDPAKRREARNPPRSP